MDLALVNLMLLAPTAAILCEIMHTELLQITQGLQLLISE